MKKTEVYELNMPEQEDFYNVEHFNENAKKTEEALLDAKKHADEVVEKLVGTAPETMDTIYELADALQENENVVDALESAITTKLGKEETAVNANMLNGMPIASGVVTTYKWSTIPIITDQGVTELGKYLDFHISETSGVDHDVRVEAFSGGLKLVGREGTGTLVANLQGTAANANVSILNPTSGLVEPKPVIKTYQHIMNRSDYHAILLYKIPTLPCNKVGISGLLIEDRGTNTSYPHQNVTYINSFYAYDKNYHELVSVSGFSTKMELARITYDGEEYMALIPQMSASSFYFTGSIWGTMLWQETHTNNITAKDYTDVHNFNPKDRITALEDVNASRRMGSVVKSVTGDYVDIEIVALGGALYANASIGNMAESTNNIYVTGCTILTNDKIRVFFNTSLSNIMVRINYFVTKV